MKLTSSNEVLAENKVLILYILDKIGEPTTDNELLKLVLSITDMNYFYFQQFMLDLLSSNYVSKYEKDKDLTALERQTTLDQMIYLALNSIIKK